MSFDRTCPPRIRDAKAFADELVRFLEDNLKQIPRDRYHFFNRRDKSRPRGPQDFDKYPLLKKHLTGLRVQRPRHAVGPLRWRYNRASAVGVVEDNVVRLIEDKAGKLSSYSTTRTSQTWLLIVAGAKAQVPSDFAGQKELGEGLLKSARVRNAANASGFDRVYFWQRHNRPRHVRIK